MRDGGESQCFRPYAGRVAVPALNVVRSASPRSNAVLYVETGDLHRGTPSLAWEVRASRIAPLAGQYQALVRLLATPLSNSAVDGFIIPAESHTAVENAAKLHKVSAHEHRKPAPATSPIHQQVI